MKVPARRLCLYILFFASLLSTTAKASLIGDAINVQQFYPNLSTLCGFGTNTWNFTVTGDASDAFTSCGGGLTVNVQGESVEITKNNGAQFLSGDFSGFVFSSLNWLPVSADLVLTDVINTTAAVTPVVELLVLDGQSFSINVEGEFWANGVTGVFDLVFEPGDVQVPVSPTLPLLGIGLVLLHLSRRKHA